MSTSYIILKWFEVGTSDTYANTYKLCKEPTSSDNVYPGVTITDELTHNTYHIQFYNIELFERQIRTLWLSLLRMHTSSIYEDKPELQHKALAITCVWSDDRDKGVFMHDVSKLPMCCQGAEYHQLSILKLITEVSSPFFNILPKIRDPHS